MKQRPLSRYVHVGQMLKLMDQRDSNGMPVEFDFVYCKPTTGELVHYDGCILTSRHSLGNTVNIIARYRTGSDGERRTLPHRPKKFRIILITQFNHATVI